MRDELVGELLGRLDLIVRIYSFLGKSVVGCNEKTLCNVSHRLRSFSGKLFRGVRILDYINKSKGVALFTNIDTRFF